MNNRGQLKIQEMAFVLVALVIFMALVSLLYLSVRTVSLRESVTTSYEQEAQALVRKLAATPELSWADCPGCVDMDKVLALKERMRNVSVYTSLWNLDYLVIEKVHPQTGGGECTSANYPQCNQTTLLAAGEYGITSAAFVTLCSWEGNAQYVRCDLGRIYASGKGVRT